MYLNELSFSDKSSDILFIETFSETLERLSELISVTDIILSEEFESFTSKALTELILKIIIVVNKIKTKFTNLYILPATINLAGLDK